MRRAIMLFAVITIFSFTFSGCRSHQARVETLQKQYDQLAKQYQQDCSGEYLDVPPKISPKCKGEEAKMNDAWNRLKTERSKK